MPVDVPCWRCYYPCYYGDYLVRGVSVVDGNGDLVTALDNDLEKKLVVISNDLNLWYALLQSALKDEEINIETIPGRYVKF